MSAENTIKLSEDDTPHAWGYWVDLNGVTFNDAGTMSWIQAMPYGQYEHPVYGKIALTPERAQQFAANVKNKIRDTDLDIDYDHKQLTTEAAGWIKDAEVRPNGLWILVEWTASAAQKIKEKAFRYFSPEFVDKWKHPKTGEVHKDVLFGGGLTNRPFLKDILPINLSDLTQTPGGDSMDRELLERLAKRLGVEFTSETSDEDLLAAVTTASETEEEEGSDEEETEEEEEQEPQAVAASDLIKLAETNPAVKRLLDRVTKLEASNQLANVNVKLSELNTQERAVAPKVATEIRSFALSLNDTQTDEFFKVVHKILSDGGVVALGEIGGGTDPDSRNEGSDVIKRFNDAAQKKLDADKSLSFADAVELVAAENEQLYSEYRNASYMREEG